MEKGDGEDQQKDRSKNPMEGFLNLWDVFIVEKFIKIKICDELTRKGRSCEINI